jgi:hypothetical protein
MELKFLSQKYQRFSRIFASLKNIFNNCQAALFVPQKEQKRNKKTA